VQRDVRDSDSRTVTSRHASTSRFVTRPPLLLLPRGHPPSRSSGHTFRSRRPSYVARLRVFAQDVARDGGALAFVFWQIPSQAAGVADNVPIRAWKVLYVENVRGGNLHGIISFRPLAEQAK